MLMVEIEKPADEPLGDWFEALRDWLDRNGGSGVSFARVGQGSDRLVYRLVFGDSVAAERFSRTFPAYVAGTSPATPVEIPELVAVDVLGDVLA